MPLGGAKGGADFDPKDRDEYAAPGNYAAGANIAGFLRVGRAMLAFGLI